MLYCMVASGAFGIEEMIPISGPGMTLLLLCIMPFIWAGPISSLVAECNAILPQEGGLYVWMQEAFGEFWGFQGGWWGAVSTYVASGTYIALATGYFCQIVPLSGTEQMIFKVAIILLFTIINLIGLREVDFVDGLLAALILIAFGVIVVLGFANWQSNPITPLIPADTSISGSLSEGLLIAIWMYCGYECIANMSGEIKDSRQVARGLKLVMPVVALSYILPTLAALASLPQGSWVNWAVGGGMTEGGIGYATVMATYLGEGGRMAFLLVAIASQFAIFNTYMASGARSFFVLADDHLFPKSIAKVDKSGRSPYVSVLTMSISALFFCQFEFTTLVDIEIVFDLAIYVGLAATVWKLRKKFPMKEREEKDLYVIGMGKFGLVYCTLLPALIATFALLVEGPTYMMYSVIALASGAAAYVVFKKIYGGFAVDRPDEHPLDPRTGLAPGDIQRMVLFGGIAVVLVILEVIFVLVGLA